MSGFDLSELLPFYLDETDEHIAALNDALLRLEQDPADAPALAEAFRMFHSIKGASVVMGFEPVNRLTHNLESLFDQFRVKKRTLDRPVLDLTFRCLDELRDYHRDLRAEGQSAVDLSGLTTQVIAALETGTAPRRRPLRAPRRLRRRRPLLRRHRPRSPSAGAGEAPAAVAAPEVSAVLFEGPERVGVTVVFEPNLPLPDMKARLVLNRLAARGRVLETHPPADQLDEVESLPEFTVFLAAECDPEELRALADVDGVARIRIEHGATNRPRTPSAEPAPAGGPPRQPSPSRSLLAGAVIEATRDPSLPSISASAGSAVRNGHRPPEPRRRAPAAPRKAKVAETIRVESDRLDYLMNLAGELVINKARFVDIARGLEELFRGSNAQALTSDTQERLESIGRGLDGLVGVKAGAGSRGELARPLGRARPPTAGQLPGDPGRAGPPPPGPRAAQGADRGDPQPGPGDRRAPEGCARHPDGPDRTAVRAIPPRHPGPEPLVGQGGAAPDQRREDRAGQADDRRAERSRSSTWSGIRSTTAWSPPTLAKRPASRAPGRWPCRPRIAATAWSSPSATTAGGSIASGSAARSSPRGCSARPRPTS